MDPATPPAPDTARLFLALWPEPEVRAALRAWRDGWAWPRGASPVHPDKLHLTLHFLGDLPAARLPELAHGLAVPFNPFELGFGEARLWPHGIAVLEPDAAPAQLLDLHASLGEALARLGLPLEARAFRPHVTLARRASAAQAPLAGAPVRWKIDRYALVESDKGGGGGYKVVRSYV